MSGYYLNSLAAERLELCYELAPPRVRQYLNAEMDHAVHALPLQGSVIELGCGYGRVLSHLAARAEFAVGIDNSVSSLKYGRGFLNAKRNIEFVCADAARLPFANNSFDLVLCIQNGISAFKIEPRQLVCESLRVCKSNGTVLFSTYTESFWEHRLLWFRLQAQAGLVGPIDNEKTGDGKIVCTDGFTAITPVADDFRILAEKCGCSAVLYEIDGSSLFCAFKSKARG